MDETQLMEDDDEAQERMPEIELTYPDGRPEVHVLDLSSKPGPPFEFTVGRAPGQDVRIDQPSVSKEHAKIGAVALPTRRRASSAAPPPRPRLPLRPSLTHDRQRPGSAADVWSQSLPCLQTAPEGPRWLR